MNLRMKPMLACLAAAAGLLTPGVLAAVTVYECKDAEGESFFAESCPPGTERVGERRLPGKSRQAPPPQEEAPPPAPVVLYTAPDCDPCDVLRAALTNRGVPYTEKDASTDPAVQAEVKALAGSITVPTLAAGDTVLTGYNHVALEQALKRAGYDSAAPAAGAEAGPAGPAGETPPPATTAP